jgi:hypothetical protein
VERVVADKSRRILQKMAWFGQRMPPLLSLESRDSMAMKREIGCILADKSLYLTSDETGWIIDYVCFQSA